MNGISGIQITSLILASFIVGIVVGQRVDPATAVVSAPPEIAHSERGQIHSIRENDFVLGNRDSDIVIVEYSDFHCPFCGRIHPILGELVTERNIAWVYRHLPLESIHPKARFAAVIAECIKKNKGDEYGWEYIDTFFNRQSTLRDEEAILAFAKEITGITDIQMEACLFRDSDEQKTVDQHIQEARLLNINGTPGGFVLNQKTSKGLPFNGALPRGSIEQLINEVL